MIRLLKNVIIAVFVTPLLLLTSCVDEQTDADVKDKETSSSSSEMGSITGVTPTLSTKVYSQDGVNMLWENKDAVALRYQAGSQTEPVSCIYTTTMAAPKAKTTFKKTSGKDT